MQAIDAIYMLMRYVYIDELKDLKLKPEEALPEDKLMNKDEVKSMKAIAGQLLWRCSNTLPDITWHLKCC